MEVSNNTDNQQFEIRIEGELAFMTYRIHEGSIYILHTEVPKANRGDGLAAKLAEHAIQYAKDKELQLVAYCPFMRTYLKRRKKD